MVEQQRSSRADEVPAGARDELLRALVLGLEEVVPGLEVLDRDLEFDAGGRADLAAVDGAGRLLIVLLADDDVDKAALEVLDTCSFVERNAELVARHVGGRARADLAPRVLVVSPRASERLLLRLAPLTGGGLELFGVKSVRSAAGERSYLVPLALPPAARGRTGAASPAVFLAALSEKERPLADQLVERMTRLDDELDLQADPSSLAWRFGGDLLLRVERDDGGLKAGVGGNGGAAPLLGPGDLDRLIEGALARLLELAGDAPRAPGTKALDPLDPSAPILTAEEIEAFRA